MCHSKPKSKERSCGPRPKDRKSTRLNSSHSQISYAVFCLKKKYVFTCSRVTCRPPDCLEQPCHIRRACIRPTARPDVSSFPCPFVSTASHWTYAQLDASFR